MKVIIILTILLSSISCFAAQKDFPDDIVIDTQKLFLCKTHTIKKAFIIKLAHVALYRKDCDANINFLEEGDKLVRFHYLIDIKAEFFKKAARESYMKNFPEISIDEKNALFDFNQFYEQIKEGDYYDINQEGGNLLRLYKNDRLIGASSEKKFTYKYFNIWFGEYPAIKPLKKAFMP